MNAIHQMVSRYQKENHELVLRSKVRGVRDVEVRLFLDYQEVLERVRMLHLLGDKQAGSYVAPIL